MKKLTVFFFVLTMYAQAQQKAFMQSPYIVLIDTTTKVLEVSERGDRINTFTLYVRLSGERLFTCYDGMFAFADTLVPGDIVQQGTTGIFKITPHAVPINTTKRNLLIGNLLLQYDNSTQELRTGGFSDTNYPITIRNRSTGIVSLRIYSSGAIYWNVLPTTYSVIGTTGIKKIIVN